VVSRSGGAKYWVMMGHSDESQKRKNHVTIPGSEEPCNKRIDDEVSTTIEPIGRTAIKCDKCHL
jgi:hypothetical protein